MRMLVLIFLIITPLDAEAKPRYGLTHIAHKTKLHALRKYASNGKHIIKSYNRPKIVIKHDNYKQND